MKTCYVMVGLPASGKSTFLKFVESSEFGDTVFVYSTDQYIEDNAKVLGKTYNDLFSDYIGKATTRMNALLDLAIKEGIDVYWDQTNLGVGKRRKIINRMRNAGYNVECIVFKPPKSDEELCEWKKRLHGRKGKTIPEQVIEHMQKNFVMSTLDEGFTRIRVYDMHGNLKEDIN